jgi:hypothetical protein
MIAMVESNVDDVLTSDVVVPWLNAGLNKLAVEVKAVFPQLRNDGDLEDVPVIDEKYHELLVLYASAMYKGQDSARMEKADYLNQFYTDMANFAENYNPPMQYRDDELVQQYKATAGQTTFTITSDIYNEQYGNLKVYVNSVKTTGFTKSGNTFTLTNPASEGDAVTAIWESHAELEQAPYGWTW